MVRENGWGSYTKRRCGSSGALCDANHVGVSHGNAKSGSGKAPGRSASCPRLTARRAGLTPHGRHLSLDVRALTDRAADLAVVAGRGHLFEFLSAIAADIFKQGHTYLRKGWSESSCSRHSWSLSLMHSTNRVFMLLPVQADKILSLRCVSRGNRRVSCFVGTCSFSDTCPPRSFRRYVLDERYIKMSKCQ